ncbi:MAG: hypothetical protein LC795_17610 [Acidobacteria bacterium]|nr:hypothetical protein [Acidobacteriota bacterium]
MQRFLLAKRAWVMLFAAVCAVYFYGLGAVPLLGPDEPRYAQVAREMYARGAWVTPTLAGHTWFEKPAMLYWLAGVAYRLFGVTEFAARAGTALSGVLTVLLRWPGLLRLGVLWGVLLALLVAATWYAPVYARHGHAFVDEFFTQHHFARYLSNRYHHPQPFWFYLPITLGLALPWTFFLFGGLAGAAGTNARGEDAAGKLRVLAVAWLLVPLVFFSASGSKLPGYVLPAIPGAALLAGDSLHRYLRGAGELPAMRLTGLLALGTAAAAAAFLFFHVGDFGASMRGVPAGYAAALVIVPGLAGLAALLLPRRRELCAVALVGATLLTVALVVASGVFGRAARKETLGPELSEASAQGLGGLPVIHLHGVERTSEFYAAGRLAYDERGEPVKLEGAFEVEEFVRARGGQALVVVPLGEERQLHEHPTLESRRVADNGRYALVHVRAR